MVSIAYDRGGALLDLPKLINWITLACQQVLGVEIRKVSRDGLPLDHRLTKKVLSFVM